jgi:glycosyltransferase involved in cell wall biosynthesis
MKKIVFTVTNDLSYDQRMDRICATLVQEGFEVLLVGRKRRKSINLMTKTYGQKRLFCFFEKGKLFYLEYNIRLFLYLLGLKFDIVCAIDLDTIAPCYFAGRIKNKKLVYDSHEYYTEVIEVVRRPKIQQFWSRVEAYFVPKYDACYTVSESIAKIYNDTYFSNFKVIRNVSKLENYGMPDKTEDYLIYIGAVNEGRGLEQTIKAMQHIDMPLYVCGDGDIFDQMVDLVKTLKLENKVKMLGYVLPDQLKKYTRNAFAGILLLDAISKSYYYSLANKFFDYIHAGIPQITIDFPEYRIINEQYQVAELIQLREEELVEAVNKLISNKMYYQTLKANTVSARMKYNWQTEAEELVKIYRNL